MDKQPLPQDSPHATLQVALTAEQWEELLNPRRSADFTFLGNLLDGQRLMPAYRESVKTRAQATRDDAERALFRLFRRFPPIAKVLAAELGVLTQFLADTRIRESLSAQDSDSWPKAIGHAMKRYGMEAPAQHEVAVTDHLETREVAWKGAERELGDDHGDEHGEPREGGSDDCPVPGGLGPPPPYSIGCGAYTSRFAPMDV